MNPQHPTDRQDDKPADVPTEQAPSPSPETPEGEAPEGAERGWRDHWLARWGSELALALVFFVAILAYQSRGLLDSGAPAPTFEGYQLDGEPWNFEAADPSGRKTVLVFWAPWCTVCGAQSSTINALADDPDLRVVTVALQARAQADVHKYIEEHQARYPVVMAGRSVSKLYRVSSFPTAYILDERGQIEHQLVGYTSRFGFWWRSAF